MLCVVTQRLCLPLGVVAFLFAEVRKHFALSLLQVGAGKLIDLVLFSTT